MQRLIILVLIILSPLSWSDDRDLTWIKIQAKTQKKRDQVANIGVSIENIQGSTILALATSEEIKALKKAKFSFKKLSTTESHSLDFPSEDADYRNYDELSEDLQKWAQDHPDFVSLDSIGKSVEGREIWHIRISNDLDQADTKPGVVFLGGHHAREHLSVETPLKLAEKLIKLYAAKDPQIVELVSHRDIHIIPVVNPDGKEFDIETGDYRMWRKNRGLVKNVVRGIDLNRNYGYGWGGGGASSDPRSETYRGPKPFSEPETRAIKEFIENQKNLSVLLSYHTFSELILYPWGHSHDSISDDRDYEVHKTMAEKMAKWNGYTPQQSSELYIASGDTTDWAYGEHKIISFTFELDPSSMMDGGFYPGSSKIDIVANKNWKPFLYLIEMSDNPYRAIDGNHKNYGLEFPIIQ